MQENHIYDIDREAEAHGYETAQPNFELEVVRTSIVPSLQSQIDTLIQGVDNGELKALEVFAVFKKIESLFKVAKEKVDNLAIGEAESYNEKSFSVSGVDFAIKNGSERLQYNEDDIVRTLSKRLKEREELVKLATKSKEPIYDADGVEVPKVSSKFDKSSLTVKFK
jgi:hypothetical protein